MRLKTIRLEEHEEKDVEWYARYWKNNCAYLIIRTEQALKGSEFAKSHIEKVLIPAIKSEIGEEFFMDLNAEANEISHSDRN